MTFEPALGIDFKDVQDILMLSGFCFMSNCVFRSFLSIMILLLEHCWVSMVFSLFMNVKRIDGCFDAVNRPNDLRGDFYNFLDWFYFFKLLQGSHPFQRSVSCVVCTDHKLSIYFVWTS